MNQAESELMVIISAELMVIILAELISIVGKDAIINNLAEDKNVLSTSVNINDLSADAYEYLLPHAMYVVDKNNI